MKEENKCYFSIFVSEENIKFFKNLKEEMEVTWDELMTFLKTLIENSESEEKNRPNIQEICKDIKEDLENIRNEIKNLEMAIDFHAQSWENFTYFEEKLKTLKQIIENEKREV